MYLLDTNHASRILQGDPLVLAALAAKGDVEVYVNAIVRAELVYMACRSEHRAANLARVHTFLGGVAMFTVDDGTADLYGSMKADLFARYAPRDRAARRRYDLRSLGVSDNDLWIAATALQHGLVLVSSDTDFARIAELRPLVVETWYPSVPGR